MTDAPKPPKRRRRKLIVAFVVLVLVSVVSWWYWPRGDARFVGTWDAYSRDQAKPYARLTFYRHGVLHGRVLRQRQELHRWHVDGDLLFITQRRFVDWKALQPAVNQLQRWSDFEIDLLAERTPLLIKNVTSDEITVAVIEQGHERQLIYRRVSE